MKYFLTIDRLVIITAILFSSFESSTSRISSISNIMSSGPTLAHPVIKKPSYYHTDPSLCLNAYVKSLTRIWELLNITTCANSLEAN